MTAWTAEQKLDRAVQSKPPLDGLAFTNDYIKQALDQAKAAGSTSTARRSRRSR
jgi:hypothetical protein